MTLQISRNIIEVPNFNHYEDDGVIFFESKLEIMLARANTYLVKKSGNKKYDLYNLVNLRIDKNTHELLIDSDFLIDLKIKLYNMNVAFDKLLINKPHLMNMSNKKYVKFLNKINDLESLKTWFTTNLQEFVMYCLKDIEDKCNYPLMLDNYTLALINDNLKNILKNKLGLRLA